MKPMHEVRSTSFPYNMADWCTEKSLNVTKALAHLAETLNGELTDKAHKEMLGQVYCALWDATKLLSFSAGVGWKTTDGPTVAEKGLAGFAALKDAYNLSNTRTCLEFRRSSLVSIREIINGPRCPNRTLLYDRLEKTYCQRDDGYEKLYELLEGVTMGVIQWEEFQKEALNELEILEKALSVEEERLMKLQEEREEP